MSLSVVNNNELKMVAAKAGDENTAMTVNHLKKINDSPSHIT
jgi:hypothetical protein